MNRNALSRIATFAVLIALVSFMVAGLIGLKYMDTCSFGNPTHNRGHNAIVSQSKSVPGAKIRHINVAVVNEDVRTKEYEGDSIRVRMYGKIGSDEETFPGRLPFIGGKCVHVARSTDNRPLLKVSQNGDSMDIRVVRKRRFATMGQWCNSSLEIDIPKQFAGELSLEGVSSDVMMARHNYEKLSVVTVSGDIMSDAFAEDVYTHSVSGDVSMGFAKSPGKISTDTVSGDITIRIPKNAGFLMDTSSISGDIASDFPIHQTSSGTPDRGHSLSGTVGNGKSTISAHTVSGDISLTSK